MKLKTVNVGTAHLAYRIFGKGTIDLVIEAGLNTCGAEWWHIAERLTAHHTVLVYDRAGYGTSSISYLERTPLFVTQEFNVLISTLETKERLIFIGHSQGALYLQQFIRLHPQRAAGLILLDPLTAHNNRFQVLLSPLEYKKCGVDKITAYKLVRGFTQFGLGAFIKPLIKKAPPFQYYSKLPYGTQEYIISALLKPSHYRTAIEEYKLANEEEHIAGLQEKSNFPDIPLILITHASKPAIEENMVNNEISYDLALKVEKINQELMQEYLTFSSRSQWIQAKKSTHHIHLSEFEILDTAVKEMTAL